MSNEAGAERPNKEVGSADFALSVFGFVVGATGLYTGLSAEPGSFYAVIGALLIGMGLGVLLTLAVVKDERRTATTGDDDAE